MRPVIRAEVVERLSQPLLELIERDSLAEFACSRRTPRPIELHVHGYQEPCLLMEDSRRSPVPSPSGWLRQVHEHQVTGIIPPQAGYVLVRLIERHPNELLNHFE